MSNEGTILHADADSFYASVEQRDDAGLRDRPDLLYQLLPRLERDITLPPNVVELLD